MAPQPPITQPPRQRLVDEVNAIAKVAQAKCDAIRSGRFSRFSPRARLRLFMIRRAIEVLALLATLFAPPDETTEAVDAVEPAEAAVPAAPIAAFVFARLAEAATIVTPCNHHSARPPSRHPRAPSRPASPPQRAGAAPNPNSIRRARRYAPHRLRTPGAQGQRLPQAA